MSFQIRQFLGVMLFLSGILCTQRISLSEINALACLVPLGLSFLMILNNRLEYCLSCLALSLVFMVDNGAEIYSLTPAIVRYAIYAATLFIFTAQSSANINRRVIFVPCLLGIWLIIGFNLNIFFSFNAFDLGILKRDIFLLAILALFFLVKKPGDLDLTLLFWGSGGLLVGEVLNLIFFYSSNENYLSFDTTKIFVIFPAIIALIQKRNIYLVLFLSCAGIFICLFMGSRMIIASCLGIIVLILVLNSLHRFRAKLYLFTGLLVFLGIMASDLSFLLAFDIVKFKAIGFIAQLLTLSDISVMEVLELLDPVRFSEHVLFFDRSPILVLLGQGPGAGLYDVNGILSFVSFEQTAFSQEELTSGVFYNFHDAWIEFGVRFGLVPVFLLFYTLVIRQILEGRAIVAFIFGILLINVTFATSGILLAALIIRFFPQQSEGMRDGLESKAANHAL